METSTESLVLDGSGVSAHAAVDGVALSAADGFVVVRSLSDSRSTSWQSSGNSDESEDK